MLELLRTADDQPREIELGDIEHELNYQFPDGITDQSENLERFQNFSPIELILHLSQFFFETLIMCSNFNCLASLSLFLFFFC